MMRAAQVLRFPRRQPPAAIEVHADVRSAAAAGVRRSLEAVRDGAQRVLGGQTLTEMGELAVLGAAASLNVVGTWAYAADCFAVIALAKALDAGRTLAEFDLERLRRIITRMDRAIELCRAKAAT